MNSDQELLCEPTAEALDEWKLFVPQSTLDEIELKYGSDSNLIADASKAYEQVRG
ncbi:TPA: hypothetical protein U9M35_002916 [Acinetobacter baumannii]|nr:hypothetical protein [Acinetobacter baumannii]